VRSDGITIRLLGRITKLIRAFRSAVGRCNPSGAPHDGESGRVPKRGIQVLRQLKVYRRESGVPDDGWSEERTPTISVECQSSGSGELRAAANIGPRSTSCNIEAHSVGTRGREVSFGSRLELGDSVSMHGLPGNVFTLIGSARTPIRVDRIVRLRPAKTHSLQDPAR
jgi:hypothetical protein